MPRLKPAKNSSIPAAEVRFIEQVDKLLERAAKGKLKTRVVVM
jgi:hypothetical protein